MKKNISLVIHIFHKLFVYFVVFGFLLPKKYLIYHLVTWPLVWFHWKTNNGYCFLTQLESRLNNKDSPNVVEAHANSGDSEFMRQLFNNIGIVISLERIHLLTEILFTTSWVISFYRYFTN
jgi:hypothetical protein